MKYPKRSHYKYAKSRYRVRNWAEYEAGLRCRGDLTIWLSEDAIKCWRAPASGKPGGQRTFANLAIEAVRAVSDEVTMELLHGPTRQRVRSYLSELLEIVNGTGRRLSVVCGLCFADLRLDRTPDNLTGRSVGRREPTRGGPSGPRLSRLACGRPSIGS
jgi:hypothetical protein